MNNLQYSNPNLLNILCLIDLFPEVIVFSSTKENYRLIESDFPLDCTDYETMCEGELLYCRNATGKFSCV